MTSLQFSNDDRAPDEWHGSARTRLGMPELNACGLSEQWLQKFCGEQHWRGLESVTGRPSQSWRDPGGARVYAAFGFLRLQRAKLDRAHEGATLTSRSALTRIGRTQAWSRHQLRCAGQDIGQLDMLSVFVSREHEGANRSVRRTQLAASSSSPLAPSSAPLIETARAWRKTVSTRTPVADSLMPDWIERPCPRSDFNGAGLLYFPSFSAFVDRALWAWGRLTTANAVTQRECLFLGNVEVGEPIRVRLLNEQLDGAGRVVSIQISATGDQRVIAALELRLS